MGDNIKVICRFRPLNQTELTMNKDPVADFLDDKRLRIKKVEAGKAGSE
jgi:hypothetical protein